MPRPSTRFIYHPTRDQIYEVYFRNGQARAVSRVVRAKGQRGSPAELWSHLAGEPSALVREVIAMTETNTAGDTYADASAAMDAAPRRRF